MSLGRFAEKIEGLTSRSNPLPLIRVLPDPEVERVSEFGGRRFRSPPRPRVRHRGPAPHRPAQPELDTIDTDADSGTHNDPSDGGRVVIADTAPGENRLVIRTRERYSFVQDLLASGEMIAATCRRLSVDRKTARYANGCTTRSGRTRRNFCSPAAPFLHQT